jgi:FKBP-type peptidyl-prolyl cis-trans isomerase SlyD
MQFEGIPEGAGDDDEDVLIYRVTEIADDKVVLDGNHPLAGMALVFTCTVTGVRSATAEVISHGHTHDDSCEDED